MNSFNASNGQGPLLTVLPPFYYSVILLCALLVGVRLQLAGASASSQQSHNELYLPLLLQRDAFLPDVQPFVATPPPLPADAVLNNAGAGWFSQHNPRSFQVPMAVAYRRFEWRDLEPVEGEYDFSKIDSLIERARERHQLVGLRVRAMLSGDSGGTYVPDYLMPYGWWHGDTFIPDWNHPYFLARARMLLQVLGERYDGKLYFVDIGMLYQYGEWSPHSIDYDLSPPEIGLASFETQRKLIDYHVEAFRQTRLVMFAVRPDAIKYALKSYPKIGLRSDALGSETLTNHFVERHDEETRALIMERWKTAPVITEFIGGTWTDVLGTYERAVQQARKYRISMVGDINVEPWHALHIPVEGHIGELARIGFRFGLSELRMPAELEAGDPFAITSTWRNEGTTPAYQSWQAGVKLRSRDSEETIWEGYLSVDFEGLMPGQTAQYIDHFTLPADAPPGEYDLILAIHHPDGAPQMALAIEGVQENGRRRWYELGVIQLID